MQALQELTTRFAKDESGVAAVEYGLVAALMSTALIALLSDVDDPNGLMGRIKLKMDSILS